MITDWDDAYNNRDHIPGAEAFVPRWQAEAVAFRESLAATGRAECDLGYGPGERHRLDLFHSEGAAARLVVFVHGGYWRAFDHSVWSHLAAGPLAHGWAVAMPSYTLAPDARLTAIAEEVARAVGFAAARVAGPLRLTGHSAGGHLVARLACTDGPLAPALHGRLAHVLPISALADLRPLLRTVMNADLRLDPAEARAESPALLEPLPGLRVTAWVGGAERPEFRRQSALLANVWTGLGADTRLVEDAGRHHFDVIEPLAEPDSPLTRALTGMGDEAG